MTATVTNNKRRVYPDRIIYGGCNVYVNSPANDIIDKWFMSKGIYNFDYKCRTWSKLKKVVNKLNIDAMRTVFGDKCDIVYSVNAGCSCGCSPGFKVRNLSHEQMNEYCNRDVWMKLDVDTSKLERDMASFDLMLEKEEAANNKLAVAV